VRYVIIGAGAVGGVIGGLLARAGRDVVLVARGPHLTALQENGLQLRTPGEAARLSLPAIASVAEADWRDGDVAVLTVKGQDTEGVLTALDAVAPAGLAVICAQNGVANERRALRRFSQVHGMCVMLPAAHLEPGVVAGFGQPVAGILDVGRYPSGTDAVDDAIAADLRVAGFAAERHPAVALAGPDADTSEVVGAAVAEGEAVLAAGGIDVATAEEDRARRADGFRVGTVEGVPRGGGSTWQSLARGTGAVEADTLNGEIVLLGRLHGVPTPVNEHLRRLVHQAARDGRPPGSTAVEALLPPT
jgi:2-dehydropantoate 2-reductase